MSQTFNQQGAPVETGLVREYVANLQNNTDTLRSNFSGSTFPVNPVAGQHCFRIDEGIEYVYDGQNWHETPEASSMAVELANSRGYMKTLGDRLSVAINEDGTLKNPIAAEIDEWKDTAIGVTYVNNNQFRVEGDLTPIFTKGRSLKIYNKNDIGEISVGGITSVVSSNASDNGTVITVADHIITSNLYDVKYGLIQESLIPQRNSLMRSTAYELKDIAYSDKLKSYMFLECIQPGTTGVTESDYRTITTPSSVGEATNITLISTNGGTTGNVTSGGAFTGTSNATIYVKLSTSTPDTVESYDTVTLSYCVGSQDGEYTEVGLADGEPQEIVDGVTVQLSTTGVFEDGEIYSIACVAEVAHDADIGDIVTDGTVTWKIRRISSADGVAVGIILPFAGNGAIPSGYLLCDGAAYSRTAFPDLFACIGTDYGSGDGSTTFNVPDSNQAKRFLQGDTVAGQTKEAGLPNIIGDAWNSHTAAGGPYFNSHNGPFGAATGSSASVLSTPNGTTSDPNAVLRFDASKANPIYGNSTTVQPDALTTRYIIKAFDGQTADSALIDITQYENELGHKVDKFDMPFNGITNNSIYRGKDLTAYFESGRMSADMATGKWDNIFVGDYIIKSVTINGVTYADVKWIVMHINYHLHCGDTETTQNHVVLMPEEQLGTRQMNPTDTTVGGYVGSAMWNTHMPLVVAGIEAAFGADHVLAHRELLTNAMNGDLISANWTAARGATSGWAWVTAKANLATEEMVYGAPIWSSSGHDSSGDTMQLAAFKLNRGLICSKRYWWWLRSVARASVFCDAGGLGYAGGGAASPSGCGVRPYFLLH